MVVRRSTVYYVITNLMVAGGVLFAGCGRVHETQQSNVRIVGGSEIQIGTSPVVSLQKYDSSGQLFSFCTGVIISSNKVLTAAHCSPQAPVDDDTPSQPLFVVIGETFPENPGVNRIPVLELKKFTGYDEKRMAKDADGFILPADAGDLALWTLAHSIVGAQVAPLLAHHAAPLLAAAKVAAVFAEGQKFTVMGFGQKDPWESPWLPHRLRTAEIPYKEQQTATITTKVLVEGRARTQGVSRQFSGRSEHEFFLGGPGYPDTCKGDSGGPVFAMVQDLPVVVGLTSRGSSSCDQGGVYTLVPSYQDWIAQVVPEAQFL